MGSDGYWNPNQPSFMLNDDGRNIFGPQPCSCWQDRPEAYPLPVERLRRMRPPKWLAEAVWWLTAKGTDAIETFGRRLGATYDDRLEDVLLEWREPSDSGTRKRQPNPSGNGSPTSGDHL